jgi:hypothetical protein
MNIMINRTNKETPRSNPSTVRRCGAWARVEAHNSDDNSVDVSLEIGLFLKRVPVMSKEWVTSTVDSEKDFNTGERDLPPLYSRVFVFMPTFTFSDCFIMPFSAFNNTDKNVSSPFLESEKENIKERITPAGWHITDDYITGSHKSVSPDEKTSLHIDYGDEEVKDDPELHLNLFDNIKVDVIAEDNISLSIFDEVTIDHVMGDSCTVKVFDTEIVIKEGEVSIKPKETTIEIDGDATIKTSGNVSIDTKGNKEEKITGTFKSESSNTDIKSKAPIGLNDGLYSTGLAPYFAAETGAETGVQTAATSAATPFIILDALSGATGFVSGLLIAIQAKSATMIAADSAANTAIAKAVK